MAFNKRWVDLSTPAGNRPGVSGNSASSEKVQAHFSFGVDGANAPPATSLRGDPFSVVRTSTGLYTITMGGATIATGRYEGGVKRILTVTAQLQKSAVSVLGAEVGVTSDSAGTVQVRVVNRSTGAAADPAAAGANERLLVIVTFDNGAT